MLQQRHDRAGDCGRHSTPMLRHDRAGHARVMAVTLCILATVGRRPRELSVSSDTITRSVWVVRMSTRRDAFQSLVVLCGCRHCPDKYKRIRLNAEPKVLPCPYQIARAIDLIVVTVLLLPFRRSRKADGMCATMGAPGAICARGAEEEGLYHGEEGRAAKGHGGGRCVALRMRLRGDNAEAPRLPSSVAVPVSFVVKSFFSGAEGDDPRGRGT